MREVENVTRDSASRRRTVHLTDAHLYDVEGKQVAQCDLPDLGQQNEEYNCSGKKHK